jgi:serine/threonine protein kinase
MPNTGPLANGEKIGPFHEGAVPYLTATYKISNASGSTTKVRKVATRNYEDKFRETQKEIRIYKRLQGFRGWEDFILPYLAGETYHNGQKVYLNFRYLPGQDLVDYTNSKPGLANLRKVALDIALALEFCLKAGITHGDIRPDNVYITMDGTEPHGRLFDFGLATVDPRNSNIRTDVSMFLHLVTEDIKACTLNELGANEGGDIRDLADRAVDSAAEQKDIWPFFIQRLQALLPAKPAGGGRRRNTRRRRN